MIFCSRIKVFLLVKGVQTLQYNSLRRNGRIIVESVESNMFCNVTCSKPSFGTSNDIPYCYY